MADRKEINRLNRGFGKSVERAVAKLVGGERTPGSGAFKTSDRNLTGDVAVWDAEGVGLAKIECKGTSTITPKGDKTFTMKKSVMYQTWFEAIAADELPILWVHWKNGDYLDDAVMVVGDPATDEVHPLVPARMFLELIRLAKLGAVVDREMNNV